MVSKFLKKKGGGRDKFKKMKLFILKWTALTTIKEKKSRMRNKTCSSMIENEEVVKICLKLPDFRF